MAAADSQRVKLRRVLLVSPSEEHHIRAREIFQHSGCRVDVAGSGTGALSDLRNAAADVVLSACDLPDCCWTEFIRAVHTLPESPPVVLFSRFADEALWAEVLRQGVWDLLSEPFDANELRRVVNMACDARCPPGAAPAATERGAEPWPAFHTTVLPAAIRQSLDGSRFSRFIAGSSEGVIMDCSVGLAAQLGRPHEFIRGRHIRDFLTDPDAGALDARMRTGCAMSAPRFLLNFVNADQTPFTLACRMEASTQGFVLLGELTSTSSEEALDEVLRVNSDLVVLAREMRRETRLRQRQGATTLRETLDELVKAYGHLRAIQEIFSLCEVCGIMYAESGKWREVVRYLERNDLLLSEGHCQRCEAKVQDE